MKRVNEEKEKINKYLDNGEPVRHEGPLSEGEDRDDYNAGGGGGGGASGGGGGGSSSAAMGGSGGGGGSSNEKFVDRQTFDGKWAEKEGIEPPGTSDKELLKGI